VKRRRKDAPAERIVERDNYEWAPMHSASGRLGPTDLGGLEVIGHDAFKSVGSVAIRAVTC
jgi:hypothetical protein